MVATGLAIGDDATRRVAPLLALLLVAVVIGLGWIADDAFITLRVARNWLDGHGAVWNVGERVQAITSPLWLLVLLSLHAIFPELAAVVGATMLSSIAIGAVGLWLVAWRLTPSPGVRLIVLALALASKAYVEFSTSGLENTLSHLLVAVFAAIVLAGTVATSFRMVVLVLALALLNRLDLAVLLLPAFLWCGWLRWRRSGSIAVIAGDLLAGGWPLALGLAVAIVYYGTPVPNTFYAKLGYGTGAEVLRQGGAYLVNSLRWDAPTLLATVVGAGVGLARGRPIERALATGVCLHLAYVVIIGGDYMTGRFFTTSFVLALILIGAIGSRGWPTRAGPPVAGAVLVASLLNPLSPLRDLAGTRQDIPVGDAIRDGVATIEDERRLRRAELSWRGFAPGRLARYPAFEASFGQLGTLAGSPAVNPDRALVVNGAIGVLGYLAGPRTHVVDPMALSDAFLARLAPTGPFLPGHLRRPLPRGYLRALGCRDPALLAEPLRTLYTLVSEATGGPVPMRPNVDYMLRRDGVTFAVADRIVARGLLVWPLADPSAWSPRLVPFAGGELMFCDPVWVRRLTLALEPGHRYQLALLAADRVLAIIELAIGAEAVDPDRLSEVDVALPASYRIDGLALRGGAQEDSFTADGRIRLFRAGAITMAQD